MIMTTEQDAADFISGRILSEADRVLQVVIREVSRSGDKGYIIIPFNIEILSDEEFSKSLPDILVPSIMEAIELQIRKYREEREKLAKISMEGS